jgi:hypothetical protein
MSATGSPLGPILRAVITSIWKRLFDNEASNQLYLPRIIKNGYPPWDLPSYDPAKVEGTSQPIQISGVPQDVADQACTSDFPISPVATSPPSLQLTNVLLTHLSEMNPVTLTFSSNEPVFAATVSVGTTDSPFILACDHEDRPNYFFQVACCEPLSPDSRECGPTKWTADANGQFVAKAHDATLALTIQLNVPLTGHLTISILSIAVQVDPKNVDVDFDVAGLPEWAQQMAQIAVQEGIGSGAITNGLQSFLNQPNVIQDIQKLINKQLETIPESTARRGANGTLA